MTSTDDLVLRSEQAQAIDLRLRDVSGEGLFLFGAGLWTNPAPPSDDPPPSGGGDDPILCVCLKKKRHRFRTAKLATRAPTR